MEGRNALSYHYRGSAPIKRLSRNIMEIAIFQYITSMEIAGIDVQG